MDEITISFRKLVDILEVEKIVNVHFIARNNLNKQNYVFFRYLSTEEIEAINQNNYDVKKEYNSSGKGIYLPDIDIQEYYNLEMQRNPEAPGYAISQFSYITFVSIKEYFLIWAIYCILHETGHWLDFIESGKTGYEYYLSEKPYREQLNKDAEKVRQINDCSPLKHIAMEQYNQKYREIPSEQNADKYAFDNLLSALEKVRKELGYSENDLL